MKPRVFIGSSSKGLEVAKGISAGLQRYAEVILWDKGVFGLSSTIIESLIDALDSSDFGVFVFSPDDDARIRGVKQRVPRDNVVFELGLFTGHLGRDRAFVVMPNSSSNLHLPTDLSGMNVAIYNYEAGNNKAAVESACKDIRSAIKKQQAKGVRWFTAWKLGPKPDLYREELVLFEKRKGLVSGIRTTRTRKDTTEFAVTGFHRSGFYWLEYHTSDCTGGGTMLLRDISNNKLVGVVVSVVSATGAIRAVGNLWQRQIKKITPSWQEYLGEFRATK